MAIQFYMRGYNTVAHTGAPIGYVEWVVNDVPDSSATFVTTVNANYVPGEIINVTTNRIVQSKVDNFLKPTEGFVPLGADSYWLHINSYDWLNQSPLTVPPNPAISVPPQITGLAIVRGTATGTTPRDFSTLFWDEVNQQWTFAFNTNGDGITVGALQNVNLGAMSMTGPLTIGSPAAHTGDIRLTNTGAIRARNFLDNADINLISGDSGNRVRLGSGTDRVYIPDSLRVDADIFAYADPGDASLPTIGFVRVPNANVAVATKTTGAGASNLLLLSSDIFNKVRYDSNSASGGHQFSTMASTTITGSSDAVSLPQSTINVANTTSFPSAGIITVYTSNGPQGVTYTGKTSTTFTGCTGGSGVMSIGNAVGGEYYFKTFDADGTHIGRNYVTFDLTDPNPFINQYPNRANTISGQPLTVQAQNVPGSGTTGGALNLSSGTATTTTVGLSSNGVSLPAGTINVISTTGFPTAGIINILSSAGLQQVQYTGTNATQFTGCTLGTGTLSTGNAVYLAASAGAVNIQSGGYNRLSVSPTTVTSADPVITFTNAFVSTTIAAGSNGATLPQATINVASTNGFPSSGIISVASSQGNQTIAYTGTTTTSFTGCTGGSNTLILGILSTGGAVVSAPLIQQSSISTASAKATTLVVQSQNNTGATSTGADLALTSGLGTTAAGNVLIQTGGVNQIIVSPTNVAAMSFPTNNNAKVIITCNLEVQGTTTTVDSTVVDIIGRVIHANWADPSVSPNVAVPSQNVGYSVHRGNISGVPRDGAAWIWTEGSLASGADGYWRSLTIVGDGYGTDGYNASTSLNNVGVMANNFTFNSDPNPVSGTMPGAGGLRAPHNTTAVASRNTSVITTLTATGLSTAFPATLLSSLSTLNVTSTTGFSTPAGSLFVATDLGPQFATYTGTTGTSFTGFVSSSSPINGRVLSGNSVSQTHQTTTIASGSNNLALPQSTINVASNVGFPTSGTLRIVTTGGVQNVTYTNISGTTQFTGASGGAGTMFTGNSVSGTPIPGSADHLLVGTDPFNHIIMGNSFSPTNSGFIFGTTTGSIADFWVNGISQIQLGAQDVEADGYAETVTIGPLVTNPRIYQIAQPLTGTNDGYNMMIQAQAGQNVAAGTNKNGGGLTLASGSAGTGGSNGVAGLVSINIGSVLAATFNSIDTEADGYAELFAIGSTITNPRIYQIATAGASGSNLLLEAQNAATNGGALNLSSGTGSVAANAGNVNIQTGLLTRVVVTPSFTTFQDTAEALRIIPLSAGTTEIRFASTDTAALIDQALTSTAAASMTIQSQVTTGNTLVGGNLNLIAGNSTGTTTLGGDGYFTSGTGTTQAGNIHIQTGGVDKVITHPSFTEFRDTAEALRITPVSTGTTQITFAATDTAAQINQTQTASTPSAPMTIQSQTTTAASGVGGNLTLNAGNATGTTSTGGNAIVTSGTGTTVAGNVQLQTGVVDRVVVHPTFTEFRDAAEAYRVTPVSAGTTSLQFATTVTLAKIFQADLTTNNVTAAPMTVQAQNETGTTSTGGALNLTSGTGTTTAGNVNLQTGGTTRVSVNPTFTTFSDAAEAYRVTPVSAGTTTLQFATGVLAATIFQADKTTNAGTGATLTVQAQNETGTTSNGGPLVLVAGTGTTVGGASSLTGGGSTTTGGAATLAGGAGTTTGGNAIVNSGAGATNGNVNLQVGGVTTASLVTNKFVFNKGRRRNITAVSTTYLVLATDDYIAVTASSVYTITLPAAPTTGDTYEFKDINGTSGTNAVTIAGNGNNIDGVASTTLNANYASLVVTYTGAQWSVS